MICRRKLANKMLEEIYLCASHQVSSLKVTADIMLLLYVSTTELFLSRWIDFLVNYGPLEAQQSHILCIRLPEVLLMQRFCVGTTMVGAPYWKGVAPFSLMTQKGIKDNFMFFLSEAHSSFSLACDKEPLLFLWPLGMTSVPRQPIMVWESPTTEEEDSFTN